MLWASPLFNWWEQVFKVSEFLSGVTPQIFFGIPKESIKNDEGGPRSKVLSHTFCSNRYLASFFVLPFFSYSFMIDVSISTMRMNTYHLFKNHLILIKPSFFVSLRWCVTSTLKRSLYWHQRSDGVASFSPLDPLIFCDGVWFLFLKKKYIMCHELIISTMNRMWHVHRVHRIYRFLYKI